MDADGIVQADMLDDAKAEACSDKLPASCLVDPVEALEDTIFIFLENADSGILGGCGLGVLEGIAGTGVVVVG